MKIFSDVRVAHHLGIGLLVVAATFGFATCVQARVLLGSPGPAALSNGLIGYWPLDGAVTNWRANTTADLSGNGNTGNLIGLSTTTSTTDGKLGQALSFNGSSSYISTTNSFNNPQSYTVSVWFKTTDASGKKIVGFENSQLGEGSNEYDRHIYMGTDGKIRFGWYRGVTVVVTSNAVLTDGKWHHAVGTHTGSMGTLYIDGKSQGTDTGASQTIATGYWRVGSWAMATWPSAVNGYFNGSIDDVRIYNRPLSATEVKQLYGVGAANAAHSNTVALSNGLVGYWTFDGSATNWTSNTTRDLSGNGNTGGLSTLSTSTSPVAGKIGQAFTFNGSQAVRIEDSTSLDVGDIVSYSMWIKPVPTGATAVFFSKDFNTAVGAFESNGTVSLYQHTGGLVLGTTATITDSKLHHLVFTKNGAAVRIYIDGAIAASTNSSSNTFSNSNSPLCLGLDSGGGVCAGFPFKGVIDDFRVYNRELSAAEVSQLYNTGAANIAHSNVWVSDGLVGYWPLDGSATNWRANTTADLSGNGSAGRLVSLGTTTAPVAGRIGQAFTFSGSQSVNIADSPSLDQGDMVSYAVWIKRARAGVQEAIFSRGDKAAVGTFESSGTVALYKYGTGLILQTSATIKDTKFHHIVFTKNGAKARIYIDGFVAASTNSASATLENNAQSLCLGQDVIVDVCQLLSFRGVIDDFRVYNRELSSAEVKQLYNAGK